MNPSGDELTELADFKEFLGATIDGELPLLAGGHAAHLWATVYRDEIGPALDEWLPLVSKDLDLLGNQSLLSGLKEQFGGTCRYSPPRSPVVGQLTVYRDGRPLKIDVIRTLYGLGPKDLAVEPMTIILDEATAPYRVRVLPIQTVFQAKVANLAHLDQTGRNDFKHVHLMILVAREYLSDLIRGAEAGEFSSRAAIGPMEAILKIVRSPNADRCRTIHHIDFTRGWPRERLSAATDERFVRFVKHRLPA